jgi:hypothetical protein
MRGLGSENQKIMKSERIPKTLEPVVHVFRKKEGIGIHKLGKDSNRNRRNV